MTCKSPLTCSLALWLTTAGAVAAGEVVRIEEYEAAGISGLRALWDIPVVLSEGGRAVERDGHLTAIWLPEDRTGKKRQVGYGELMAASVQGPEERLAAVCEAGALGFDALHRKMLVRFPRAADVIANKIATGHAVEKIEVVLPFRDTELHPFGDINSPLGYTYRMNWGVKDWWSRVPPNWHAVAWALRKPWVADHRICPTYNAYIRNAGYWAHFEARDDAKDRFAPRFGPTEVSHEVADGRLDVTEVFRDERFGGTADDMARVLLVFGMKKAPLVELNGRPLDRKLSNASVDGRDAWVVPLFHEARLTDASARLIERYRLATGELGRSAKQGR
ncbi:MAG: hypothetical protein FJ290_03530 [Planctomycetes bacterium]|nr:hypothetical protein [Planctomycetota bacterium]